MFAVALAVPLMLRSVPAEAYNDIWNSSIPLLPFTLLLFVGWSVASGEHRWLPLMMLLGSFVVQCHLSYVAPTAGIFVIASAGLAFTSRRRDPTGSSDRSGRRRWVLAAVVCAGVCWSAPALDQVFHRPGNGVLLFRAATTHEPTLGAAAGWRAAVHAIGVPPWWPRAPRAPLQRIGDVLNPVGTLSVASAIVFVLVLAGLIAVGSRRRRADIATACALGLVLVLAVALDAASTPRNATATVFYTLRWASPVGMWVWVVGGWAAATAVWSSRFPALRPRLPSGLRISADFQAATAISLVMIVAGAVALTADVAPQPYEEFDVVAKKAREALPAGGTVRVEAAAPLGELETMVKFQAGLVYALRHDGHRVRAPQMARKLGAQYTAGPARDVLHVDIGSGQRSPGIVVARVNVPSEAPSARASSTPVVVTLRPGR